MIRGLCHVTVLWFTGWWSLLHRTCTFIWELPQARQDHGYCQDSRSTGVLWVGVFCVCVCACVLKSLNLFDMDIKFCIKTLPIWECVHYWHTDVTSLQYKCTCFGDNLETQVLLLLLSCCDLPIQLSVLRIWELLKLGECYCALTRGNLQYICDRCLKPNTHSQETAGSHRYFMTRLQSGYET